MESNKPIPYLRVIVKAWTDNRIEAVTADASESRAVVFTDTCLTQTEATPLTSLLRPELPMNLLHIATDSNGCLHPRLIILHPDYLVDISALATCFREFGHHPLLFLLNKLKPRALSAPILLGNLAGQLLDDLINEQDDYPATYVQSLRKLFEKSLLEFAACPLPLQFHDQARQQQENLKHIVHHRMPEAIHPYNKAAMVLEASFICERLGLQGRVDMLQKDMTLLVEQKSGRKDEYRNQHKEDHYVQMMLYQGILMYNFGLTTDKIQSFLLYSKYEDGLMHEQFSELLFQEAMAFRNEVVAVEMTIADGKIGNLLEGLTPESLLIKGSANKLWTHYQRPELQHHIAVYQEAGPLEKAYFNRFATFITREQIIGKTGGGIDSEGGFASLWHFPLSDKIESGNILTDLHIQYKTQSAPYKGYDLIELTRSETATDNLPNFRKGDLVIFYPYDTTPDVRNQMLMKGSLVELTDSKVVILLRNGQQNKDIFGEPHQTFAIEHDATDSGYNAGMRNLYQCLSAPQERRDLLLGIRQPISTPGYSLHQDYGSFNEAITKACQADDYFLLVGPPGTGKTSCALRYLVEEALLRPNASILLLAYTNRAVDEICGMLVDSGIAGQTPFIRLGNELACDERYTDYLLKKLITPHLKLHELTGRLTSTRIYVSTVATLNAQPYLFNLKHFELALIDEASQVLEPDLIGILSATYQGKCAINRFMLIGDYKQLPAISQQTADEAAITDALLTAHGFTDCRLSLFERLYRQCPDSCKATLHKQGRMHPDIAHFVNTAFYLHEHLEPIPLPHQLEGMPYPADAYLPSASLRAILNHRMLFFPTVTPISETLSDKTNAAEAHIVAMLTTALYELTQSHFQPAQTLGIIVPYRNQIALIRRYLAQTGIAALQNITIDTVERYQGSQRDIILYSFTVSNRPQLDLLTAHTFCEGNLWIDRKLNVALTRARKQLILTGNPQLLQQHPVCAHLIRHIRSQGGYVEKADWENLSFQLYNDYSY